MKLTKGKISKLYNKKKQSLKKINKKKNVSKNSRSFKRKNILNLATKTLKKNKYKKLKGGVNEEILNDLGNPSGENISLDTDLLSKNVYEDNTYEENKLPLNDLENPSGEKIIDDTYSDTNITSLSPSQEILNKVIDLITEKVSDKLLGKGQQNGYTSVPQAIGKLNNINGGKK